MVAAGGEPFGLILSVLSTAPGGGLATRPLHDVNGTEEVPFATQERCDAVLNGEDIRPALIEDDVFILLP